jgi:WD40 repeat protein
LRRRWRFAVIGVVASSSLLLAGLAFVSLSDRAEPSQSRRAHIVAPAQEPGPYTDRFYVVDPKNYSMTSQVLALSRKTGEVVRSYPAGYDPALALSPDGRTLYIASADPDVRVPGQNVEGLKDTLAVVDSETGAIRQTVELRSRVLHAALASTSTMTMSTDGRLLYYAQVGNGSEGERSFSVGTFDTVREVMLPQSAEIDQCGDSDLFALEGRELAVLCSATNDLRVVELADDGSAASVEVVEIENVPDDRTDSNGNFLDLGALAGGAVSPDASTFYAVSQNGKIFVIDLGSGEITSSHQLDLPKARVIDYGRVALLSSGAQLAMGSGRFDDYEYDSDEIVVVDTSKWSQQAPILTTRDFWSIETGPGGSQLWALGKESSTIQIVDPSQDDEIRVVKGIGESPELGQAPLLGTR